MSNNPDAKRPQPKSESAHVTTVAWGVKEINISLPKGGVLITSYEPGVLGQSPRLDVLRNGALQGTIPAGFSDSLEVNAGDVIVIPLTELLEDTSNLTYFYSGD